MILRYSRPEMTALWSEEARWNAALKVELAVLVAQAERGDVPAAAAALIAQRATVNVARITELEAVLDHDLLAFVNAVAESVGPEGRYLHAGLTSSDVVDTALALQLRDAGALIDAELSALIAMIVRRAHEERETIMIGRTHGMHAEPMTFGAKLAGWAFEADRSRQRLRRTFDEVATGKISGPVGTYSQLDPAIEQVALAALGLHADPVSTQIVQRDRHAALLAAIAVAGGSLERFATEVRLLQQSEIDEVREPFRTGQAGSSAMPQKRNPIKSERIAGLARVLRGYAASGMENQALWHERDISHSSAERIILPDATTLLHYALVSMRQIVEGMEVRRETMRRNLDAGLGLHAASRLLRELVDAGLVRDAAYGLVQAAAQRARETGHHMRDEAAADAAIMKRLDAAALSRIFDESLALANAGLLVDRLAMLRVNETPTR
jgi:adenylosuccinate lyase